MSYLILILVIFIFVALIKTINYFIPDANVKIVEKDTIDPITYRKKQEDIQSFVNSFLSDNESLICRFIEISYRKVKILDEYGEENRDQVNEEFVRLIRKIKNESLEKELAQFLKKQSAISLFNRFEQLATQQSRLGLIYKELITKYLSYEEEQNSKRSGLDILQLDKLSGPDFESFLMNHLKEIGMDHVSGTKGSGDQGADILFEYNGIKFVIQAKRWKAKVGNKAIQEVYAATYFYNRDVGIVITSSSFSSSARELASTLGIILIEGHEIAQIKTIIEKNF